MMEKEKIINAFNNAWNKKIASENSYGKLASKEMFENKEEIMIDGVNVAGCEHHLSTGYCQLQMIFQGMVFKLPFGKHLECNLCIKDCYYKQLKRLEHERNDLRIRLLTLADTYQETRNVCKRLEQENKALKDNNNHLQAIIDDGRAENKRFREENKELKEENETAQKEYWKLEQGNDFLAEKVRLYRSALEEIREKIKSLNKDICNNCGWHNTDNCQPNGYVCHDLIEIKNKINEVLG